MGSRWRVDFLKRPLGRWLHFDLSCCKYGKQSNKEISISRISGLVNWPVSVKQHGRKVPKSLNAGAASDQMSLALRQEQTAHKTLTRVNHSVYGAIPVNSLFSPSALFYSNLFVLSTNRPPSSRSFFFSTGATWKFMVLYSIHLFLGRLQG